jgi:hypothetical protein
MTMSVHQEFLLEEAKALRQEISRRQSCIFEIGKNVVVLVAAIYSVALVARPGTITLRYALVFLMFMAPIAVLLGMVKIVQNAARILQISEYIKSAEKFFLRTLDNPDDPKGWESFLRPDKPPSHEPLPGEPSKESYPEKIESWILGKTVRTEYVNYAEFFVLVVVFVITLLFAVWFCLS